MSRTFQRYRGLELKIPSRNKNQISTSEISSAGAREIRSNLHSQNNLKIIQLKSVNSAYNSSRTRDREMHQIPSSFMSRKAELSSDIHKSPSKDTNYLPDSKSIHAASPDQNFNEREIFK